jgi:hypothetical protein
MLFLRTAVAVGAVFATSVSGYAADPFVGEWGGDCGPKAQCWVEITKTKGKNYHFRFVAADRMDAEKVLCKADIPMERGRLDFTAREQYEDALSGSYKSDPLVWVLPFGGTSIQFSINDEKCGKFDMMQEYHAYGD